MKYIFLGSEQLLFKKTIHSFFIFFFCCPVSLKAQEDFPWEMFLPAITAKPRCDSKNLSLCQTVSDCYYNSGYWYFNKCNSTPIASNSLKYILIDNVLVKYKANDTIFYKGNISGNFLYYNGYGQCIGYPVNLNGDGSTRYSFSPLNGEILASSPPFDPTDPWWIMRETVNFYINSNSTETIVDFLQEKTGTISVVHDSGTGYHNYPYGVVWTKSPLNIGLSWNFDYPSSITPIESTINFNYYHRGNYKVISKETVFLDIGNFDALKVHFTYERDKVFDCKNCLYKESGYVWYYPKIGIIKADLTVGSFMDGPCFGYYKLKYEMTGSNLLKNNLPRE